MPSETLKKRKAIRERVKGQSSDSDDGEYEERNTDGSTCLYGLYMAALIGGIGVLLTLASIHHSAVDVSSPRLEDWTSVRPPGVQDQTVHTIYRSPQDPPPAAEEAADIAAQDPPQDVSGSAASAGEPSKDGAAGESTSRAEKGENANADPANVALPEERSVAPDPLDRVQEPLQHEPLPVDQVHLEGSEPLVEADQIGEQPKMVAKQEVRVRQVIERKIHPDGSVTEEVVAEYVLQPGEEGYDDVGKEPVVVSHGTVSPIISPPGKGIESTTPA